MSKTTSPAPGGKLTAEALAFRAAYLNGRMIAAAYEPGDLFLGAWGEADAIGYPAGSIERVCFTTGYLEKLRGPVVTSGNGRIVQLGVPSHG